MSQKQVQAQSQESIFSAKRFRPSYLDFISRREQIENKQDEQLRARYGREAHKKKTIFYQPDRFQEMNTSKRVKGFSDQAPVQEYKFSESLFPKKNLEVDAIKWFNLNKRQQETALNQFRSVFENIRNGQFQINPKKVKPKRRVKPKVVQRIYNNP